MLVSRHQSSLLVFLLFLPSLALCVLAQGINQSDNHGKDQTRQPSQFELLAKGVVATPPIQIQFKSAPLRLEIRNLVMGRGETESIPTLRSLFLVVPTHLGAPTVTIRPSSLVSLTNPC